MLVLAGLLVLWGGELLQRFNGMGKADAAPSTEQQLALVQEELTRVTMERDQLAATAAAPPATPAGGVAQGQTATQIKALEVENSKLTNDLLLVESLLPAEKAGAGLVIRALQADLPAPGQLHYVLLLGHGASKAEPLFAGQLQLTVMVNRNGINEVLEFPAEKSADAHLYDVTVRSYQRLDGLMPLPEGATAKAVQVRLLSKGRVVARQSTSVKESGDVRP